MNCPNCQTVNPDGARFCFNCGAALAQTCANCKTPLPAGAKFCFHCGQPAPAVPASPPLPATRTTDQPSLQQFVPRELLAKLESARAGGAMEGERRIVTMLFCDVKGSTAAAAQLDPEEWAEIINGAFECMIAPVYRYEGTVARLMGDGLLAFFGAPIAHEDDPQRAVLAGLEIQAAMKTYGQQVIRRWNIDLSARVGINTGLVVVGAVGSDLRMEYTALGDAINLAARMEQTAQPGTVQIAEPTYRLIAPLFQVETREGIEVKGKAEPVRAYRVLQQLAVPGSLRGIAGLRSRLIGRDQELAALWSAVEAARQGRGGLAAVMGEAGLGKSRLIAEVRDSVVADPSSHMQWLEGRSLSYETATPFAPFVDLLTQCFGLEPQQSDREKYTQIQARLDTLPHTPGADSGVELAPFLASLLGLEIPAPDNERVRYLEPPRLRARVFASVATLVERLAASQPLALMFDDVHWIDPTSLDLLETLLPLIDRVPLLLVAAFRPRRDEPSWRLHELGNQRFAHAYTAITLQPLDPQQARAMVANLLHVEDLPESVRQLILDKSEGNPFFVEEVIRSLLDSGLVVREDDHWRATTDIVHLAVPDTLVGVITARLDRLDEQTRHLVQGAAVLGREFSYDTLTDLFPSLNGQLNAGLADLVRRELIREKSLLPQHSYVFKHVLTQEAAYNSVLLSRRRDLHRLAAQSLVRRTPEQAGDIARHFLEARQPAQALPFLTTAGDQAARNYAAAEAIGHYQQALALQSSVEDLASVRRAYEGLGSMLALTNQAPQAMETYAAMLALAESRDDLPMQVSALNKLATVSALHMGQFALAEQYLARSDRLQEQALEPAGVAESALIRCQMCTAQADFDGVVQHMGHLVDVGQQVGSREFQVMGMEHISSSLVFMTRFDEAWEKGQEGLAAARAIGDRLHESSLLTTTLPLCLMRNGDLDGALALALEGIDISSRIGSAFGLVFGTWLATEIHRCRGDYDQALAFGQQCLDAALPVEPFMPFLPIQALGSLGSVYLEISPKFHETAGRLHLHALHLLESPVGAMGGGTAWADVGWCALGLGDVQIASECFAKGLNYPSVFIRLERPRHLAGSAMLAARQGRLEEAIVLAQEACAYAQERRMRHVAPLVHLSLGNVLAAAGRHEAALSEFAVSEREALAQKMRPAVWQAKAAAAHSLDALGRSAEAHQQRSAAQSIIEEISAHCKSGYQPDFPLSSVHRR